MSERDAIERAARVAEQIEPPAGYREHYEIAELSGFDCASSMIAAAIRALPPAEPEEVSEAMIEAGRLASALAIYLAMRAARSAPPVATADAPTWRIDRAACQADPRGKTMPEWAAHLFIGGFGDQGWAAYDQRKSGEMTASGKWGDSLELLHNGEIICRPAADKKGGA